MRAGRVLAAGFAILSLAACTGEGLTAWSQYWAGRHTMESLDRASRLVPGNAVLWRERGVLRLDSDPHAARDMLLRASALNVFDADALIGLGLLAESEGRRPEAEDYLTRAARISRRFKPKAALSFFYARHDSERFWAAATDAAEVEGADPEPVFRIMNPLQAEESLSLRSQHALKSYAGFLLKRKGAPGLGPVALKVDPTPDSRPLLAAATDRLIEECRTKEAVALWNRVHKDHPLDPAAGASLTNARFSAGEHGGFDWRLSNPPGIDLREGAPGDFRIEFSPHHSESATLLEQFVPVVPGKSYRLTVSYQTSGLNGYTDVSWHVASARPASSLSAASALLAPVAEGRVVVTFQAGPGVDLVRMALRYSRSPGRVRLEGAIVLRLAELALL